MTTYRRQNNELATWIVNKIKFLFCKCNHTYSAENNNHLNSFAIYVVIFVILRNMLRKKLKILKQCVTIIINNTMTIFA